MHGVSCSPWSGQRRLQYLTTELRRQAAMGSGEALKTRSDAADGTPVFWRDATTYLANLEGMGMAVLEWRDVSPWGYLPPSRSTPAAEPSLCLAPLSRRPSQGFVGCQSAKALGEDPKAHQNTPPSRRRVGVSFRNTFTLLCPGSQTVSLSRK
jgi:hypothetical protein